MNKKNIVLIGMPSSGKSTAGPILADFLGMGFIDTDTVIMKKESKKLRDIVNDEGVDKFHQIQERTILELILENHVIATGGSVPFSPVSMEHLRSCGIIAYLKLDYSEIQKRVTPDRRFAREKEQSLLDLYNERIPLYEKYADIIVDCAQKEPSNIADEIREAYHDLLKNV